MTDGVSRANSDPRSQFAIYSRSLHSSLGLEIDWAEIRGLW